MPIIYIRCKARTQTNTRRPLQAGEMGIPSPRSEQLHTMGNHTQNEFQGAHPRPFQGERWARPRPVWYASRPEPCAHDASRTPSPARVCVRIYLQVSPYLHHTNGLQSGGCPFSFEVCSKSQFALTVKKLTCFPGFDLRIAVFGKYGF